MRQFVRVVAASAALSLAGCGGGGASGSSPTWGTPSSCVGSLPATVPTPTDCGASVETAFFREHFQWITSSTPSGTEFSFERVSASGGTMDVTRYDYNLAQNQYEPQPEPAFWDSDNKVQAASGAWVRFQREWLNGAALGSAVATAYGNEYPFTVSSPDDPTFTLALRFKNILAADISGLSYAEARFDPSYLDGATGTYPTGSRAYTAAFVLMEPANLLAATDTGTISYTDLQDFRTAYTTNYYCLQGYAVLFDAASDVATMVLRDAASTDCVPKSGAVPVQVDVSTASFNSVPFLVLSGPNLPGSIATDFGNYSGEYTMLVGVSGNVVTTAFRLPAGATFDFQLGFGSHLNRTAINAMLTTVGRPEVP